MGGHPRGAALEDNSSGTNRSTKLVMRSTTTHAAQTRPSCMGVDGGQREGQGRGYCAAVTHEIPDDVRRAGERARRALEGAAAASDPQRYAAAAGAAAQELFDAAVLAGLLPLVPDDGDPSDETSPPRSAG